MKIAKTLAVGLILAAVGCSSRSDSASRAEAQLPVPECDAYAQRVTQCFHRSDLHDAVATRAHDEAERDRMRAACSQNLQRLVAACR